MIQVFSWKFWKVFKDTFLTEQSKVTASECCTKDNPLKILKFSYQEFFSNCEEICSYQRICLQLLKTSFKKISFLCNEIYSINFVLISFSLNGQANIRSTKVLEIRLENIQLKAVNYVDQKNHLKYV